MDEPRKTTTQQNVRVHPLVRWPRGKYNGELITGVQIKFCLDFLHWTKPKCGWNFGAPFLHFGPLHFWFGATYRRGT